MDILKFIIGLFTGQAGASVGGAVSSVAQIVTLIAAITPIGLWIVNNKNEVFVTITYGDLLFWGLLAGLLLMILRLVHRAPPPQ